MAAASPRPADLAHLPAARRLRLLPLRLRPDRPAAARRAGHQPHRCRACTAPRWQSARSSRARRRRPSCGGGVAPRRCGVACVVLCLGVVAYVVDDRPAADADRRLPRLARRVLHRHRGRAHADASTTARAARPRSARPTPSAAGAGIVAPLVVGLAVAHRARLAGRCCSSPCVLVARPVVAPWAHPHPAGARGATAPRTGRRRLPDPLLDRLGRGHRLHRRRVLPDAVGCRHPAQPRPASAPAPRPRRSPVWWPGMFVGRLVGGRLALRFGVDQMLYGALAVAAGGFALFWASTWAPLAIAGLLDLRPRCRAALPARHRAGHRRRRGPARPGRGARVARRCPRRREPARSRLGALADQIGLHKAFLVVPALLRTRRRRRADRRADAASQRPAHPSAPSPATAAVAPARPPRRPLPAGSAPPPATRHRRPSRRGCPARLPVTTHSPSGDAS